MLLISITGGVGMGKTACAELLSQRGVPVIDTDQVARAIVAPGQPALEEVRQAFGPEVVDESGRLRRDILARKVFADQGARKQLESILHPRIRTEWLRRTESWRSNGLSTGAVVIPLLFETAAESEFDFVICVACSRSTQLNRLRSRGWPQEQIDQRIAAQWPIDRKIAKANFVVWSEGSLEVHAAQLDKILSYSSAPKTTLNGRPSGSKA